MCTVKIVKLSFVIGWICTNCSISSFSNPNMLRCVGHLAVFLASWPGQTCPVLHCPILWDSVHFFVAIIIILPTIISIIILIIMTCWISRNDICTSVLVGRVIARGSIVGLDLIWSYLGLSLCKVHQVAKNWAITWNYALLVSSCALSLDQCKLNCAVHSFSVLKRVEGQLKEW